MFRLGLCCSGCGAACTVTIAPFACSFASLAFEVWDTAETTLYGSGTDFGSVTVPGAGTYRIKVTASGGARAPKLYTFDQALTCGGGFGPTVCYALDFRVGAIGCGLPGGPVPGATLTITGDMATSAVTDASGEVVFLYTGTADPPSLTAAVSHPRFVGQTKPVTGPFTNCCNLTASFSLLPAAPYVCYGPSVLPYARTLHLSLSATDALLSDLVGGHSDVVLTYAVEGSTTWWTSGWLTTGGRWGCYRTVDYFVPASGQTCEGTGTTDSAHEELSTASYGSIRFTWQPGGPVQVQNAYGAGGDDTEPTSCPADSAPVGKAHCQFTPPCGGGPLWAWHYPRQFNLGLAPGENQQPPTDATYAYTFFPESGGNLGPCAAGTPRPTLTAQLTE